MKRSCIFYISTNRKIYMKLLWFFIFVTAIIPIPCNFYTQCNNNGWMIWINVPKSWYESNWKEKCIGSISISRLIVKLQTSVYHFQQNRNCWWQLEIILYMDLMKYDLILSWMLQRFLTVWSFVIHNKLAVLWLWKLLAKNIHL